MARAFQFDVGPVVEQLNRILQMELAAVIYYTHYSFMIYCHARIPITSWLRDNATESLAHAQEAGEMIMRLHRRLALVKDKSVVLEEYATRLVSAEAVHLREMELMLMKRAPD
jgi:bacterioferritin